MIEAGVAAGYLISWAVRKIQRVAGRLDAEADQVIDAGLDHLHEVVATKLSGHPVLAELVEEAETAGNVEGISDLTLRRMELELTAAAQKDDAFGRAVTASVARLREAEQMTGRPIIASPGSVVFTGNTQVRADGAGIAIGQAGMLSISQAPPDPRAPGRNSH